MLNTKQKSVAQKIWDQINSANHILLHFHRGPDGDSVGSNMAMAMFLQKQGKQVSIANAEQVGEHLHPYLDPPILIEGSPCKLDMSGIDLHLSLDSADLHMACGESTEQISEQLNRLKRINIDHHTTNTLYGDINLVIPEVKSTCEVLYFLFKHWEIQITPAIASALILGVVTDTGGFRWQGTNAQTLKTASELMEKGGDLSKAVWQAYRNIPFNVLKYWQKIIENMEFDYQKKMVISLIKYQVFEELGKDVLKYDDTQNVLMSNVAGSEIGVLITEKDPGQVSVSFRSRTGTIDVGSIAKRLGGGGHRMAAGCSLNGIAINEAKDLVIPQIDQELKEKA